MAFTLLNPSTNRLSVSQATVNAYTNIPINYTYTSSNKWIYCNFIEKILGEQHFGDYDYGNKCLNQQTVSAGTHKIFFSYQYTRGDLPTNSYFGIQVYNPNSSSITYTENNRGYGFNSNNYLGDWIQTAGTTVHNFLSNSSSTTQTIQSNKSIWLPSSNYALPSGTNLVTGLIKFNVSGSAIITVYMYSVLSNINGKAEILEKTDGNAKQYSGISDGIKYQANITLKASELNTNPRRVQTCKQTIPNLTLNGVTNTSDLRPIKLANPSSTTISSTTANQNLGNWGFPYEITLTLNNDTSSSKTFYGYVRTDAGTDKSYELIPVINSGSNSYWTSLESNNTSIPNSWRFFSKSVNANSTYTDTFTFVNGTNGTATNSLFFRLD